MFKILRLLQFLPLTIFLYFSRENIQTGSSDWAPAFQMGALAAVIELCILLPLLKTRISRLITAVNLYLIIGGFGFYFNINKILVLLGKWGESGLMLMILLVILAATVFTEIGAFENLKEASQPKLVRLYSLILVGWCVIACVYSWMNKGHVKIAGVVPFISIVIVKYVLEKQLIKSQSSKA